MVRKQAPADESPDLHGTNGSAKEISIIPLEAAQEIEHKVELRGKVALIVGGATENGHSLAVAFAERGVDVVLVYFNSAHEMAVAIKEEVEARGRRCLLISGEAVDGDVDKMFASETIAQIMDSFGRLDIFINYSAHAFPLGQLVKREDDAQENVRSQVFPHFNMMKAALDELTR